MSEISVQKINPYLYTPYETTKFEVGKTIQKEATPLFEDTMISEGNVTFGCVA